MAAIALLLVFATALIGTPIALTATGHPLGAIATSIMTIAGVLIYVLCGVFLIITKLYHRTKASEAFVRTGWGGMKVIMDGGAIVIPFAHETVPISLEVLKLPVKRENGDALITSDNLRADVHAEFFVRCQADEASIKNAARAFGEKMNDHAHVTKLVEEKLVNALRSAATRMTLQELNRNRDEFVKQVTETVKHELASNGLTLDTVTISKLDQTDPAQLKDSNIFDAQGKATIAKIVQEKLTERNQLEKAGDQAREQQNVETRKQILALQQSQAEAEAAQAAEVAKIQADKSREAREAAIQAERQVALADVEKQKQLEVAQRQQQQATEVAERAKQKAVTEAEQQLEVAKRKQQEAIAQAERERTAAEAELATAEAEREKARQQVKTVEVEAAAEREKKKLIIEATAVAEQQFVTAQKAADAEAYAMKAKADGQKAAADAEAEAVTKKAQAEANAKKALAEGEKALQLVPVQVQQEQVEVEKRRVEEVLKEELKARDEFGQKAQEFELAKLEVVKRAEVQIEAAKATAQLYGSVNATLYGSPEDLTKMTQRFMQGMGIANMANGFSAGANGETREALESVAGQLNALLGAAAKKLGVKPEDLVESAAEVDAAAKPAASNGAQK